MRAARGSRRRRPRGFRRAGKVGIQLASRLLIYTGSRAEGADAQGAGAAPVLLTLERSSKPPVRSRMKGSVLTTEGWALLIMAAVLVAAGTLNFAQRLTHTPPATDGVEWAQTPQGVVAVRVAPDSAAGRKGVFGIMPGDRLVGIKFDEGRGDEVTSASDVQIYLEEAGTGGRLIYVIERHPAPGENAYYECVLDDLRPVQTWATQDVLINLIGVVYLLVGFFVFFKQGGRAPFALHFATLCLVAFVFHFYKPYGAYEDLDLAIYFLDNAALVLFAPVFLHFCAINPVRYRLSERRPWLVYLLYGAPLALVALDAVSLLPSVSPPFNRVSDFFPVGFDGRLWRAQGACLSIAPGGGAGILVLRFLKSESTIVRQQLKWG